MERQTAARPLICLKSVVKRRKEGAGYSLTADGLAVDKKARIALLGDSGSGKSTLLDLMAMVLKPDEAAEFSFYSQADARKLDLWQIWKQKKLTFFENIRRSELGYIMQTGGLLPFLKVRDNITLPAEIKPGYSAKIREERLDYLVTELRIGHLLKKYPTEVSMGERQRCAIARALIHNPSLVLADEPTASLDPPTADKVFELLINLCQDSALVVSTHDHRRIATRKDFAVWRITCRLDADTGSIKASVNQDAPVH
jgi:putative ABC transport system ATP-binding protein